MPPSRLSRNSETLGLIGLRGESCQAGGECHEIPSFSFLSFFLWTSFVVLIHTLVDSLQYSINMSLTIPLHRQKHVLHVDIHGDC